MPEALTQIGLRPTLAGVAVLIIGVLAGAKLAIYRDAPPIRLIRLWLDHVISHAIRSRFWLVRTLTIFFNNSLVLSLMILVGAVPYAAWIAVLIVGFSMGVALSLLLSSELTAEMNEAETSNRSLDAPAVIGLLLNLVEIPAIIAALGLCMGQHAAPNGMAIESIWIVVVVWILPALAIAAAGESTWIGRLQPFAGP